jgi:hypothetical protein
MIQDRSLITNNQLADQYYPVATVFESSSIQLRAFRSTFREYVRHDSRTVWPRNDPKLSERLGRFIKAMDRPQFIEQVARMRLAADECDRLRAAEAGRIRSLRTAGKTTTHLEAKLIELETECDRHIAEMERLLDELDKISPGAEQKGEDLSV